MVTETVDLLYEGRIDKEFTLFLSMGMNSKGLPTRFPVDFGNCVFSFWVIVSLLNPSAAMIIIFARFTSQWGGIVIKLVMLIGGCKTGGIAIRGFVPLWPRVGVKVPPE